MKKKRDELREQKKFEEADKIRKQIEEKGWILIDNGEESKILPKD